MKTLAKSEMIHELNEVIQCQYVAFNGIATGLIWIATLPSQDKNFSHRPDIQLRYREAWQSRYVLPPDESRNDHGIYILV